MTRQILVDTHALLWWLAGDARLSEGARQAIATAEVRYVSAASIFEMVYLEQKKDAPKGLRRLLDDIERHLAHARFDLLPLHLRDVETVRRLPWLHKDPWDRVIVAQAICRRLTLVSADETVQAYDVPCIW